MPWVRSCMLVAVAAIAILAGRQERTHASPPGPLEHTWSATLSDYSVSSHPTLTVSQALQRPGGVVSPPDASFIEGGVISYTGLWASSVGGSAPSPIDLGDDVGALMLTVQSNLDPNIPVNHNNVDSATGQPPRCGAPGTLPITPPAVELFVAVTSGSDTVRTDADPLNPPYAFDQEPDTAKGGAPQGVSHPPDWYAAFVGALGVPTQVVVARSFGIAQLAARTPTSVNVLTLDVGGTNDPFVVITVVGSPKYGPGLVQQTVVTCAPASSTLQLFGTGRGHAWNCTDYFGNDVGPCTALTADPGRVLLTAPAAPSTLHVQQALYAAPNPDSDTDFANSPLWSGLDNCPVDVNPPTPPAATQPDANGSSTPTHNGIGNSCSGGGREWTNFTTPVPTSTENTSGSATLNAAIRCTGFETSHQSAGPQVAEAAAPFAACQDADQDGVLNSIDNCPLTANLYQTDADGEGIGDACDRQSFVPGLSGALAQATPERIGALNFVQQSTTVGGYYDLCDAPIIISSAPGPLTPTPTPTPPPTCSLVSASGDGVPDFAVVTVTPLYNALGTPAATGTPGTPVPVCVQNHSGQTIGDGYSDADHAMPSGTPPCPTPAAGMPVGYYPPDPSSGSALAGIDHGCFTNPYLAAADVSLNGQVQLGDLILISGQYGVHWYSPSEPAAERDLSGNGTVDLTDLIIAQAAYAKNVDGDCGKHLPPAATLCATWVSPWTPRPYDAANGGCGRVQRWVGPPDTYLVTWDRLPQIGGTDNHTVLLECTGNPLTDLSFPVTGKSGRYVFQSVHSVLPGPLTPTYTVTSTATPTPTGSATATPTGTLTPPTATTTPPMACTVYIDDNTHPIGTF